jgi:lipid II:glycine glycyltransferase (peptidoglycan interpeptide bridge formation enzyme)
MYTFKIQEDLGAYDRFIEENGGQYIQCSRWQKVKTTWKCRFYGGFDGEKQLLACLVMERKLPVVGKIWYGCGGAVCDWKNTALIGEFTDFIRQEMKKHGAACFITDPPVDLRVNGEDREEGHALHSALVGMGYKLNSSIDNYTYKQPVQLFIPLRDENGETLAAEKILKKCDKGVRYSIRIGEQRGLVAKSFTAADIEKDPTIMDDFMAVMRDTGERDSFVGRDGAYCLKLLREFDSLSDLKLVYYDKALDRKLQEERLEKKTQALAALEGATPQKERQLKETIDSIDKQTEHYEKRMAEAEEFTKEERICLAGGLSIYYAGMGSCLFGGTRNVIRNNTRSSHYLNYLRLKESISRGCEVHDLGYVIVKKPELNGDGTLGELVPQDNFKGIYEFKKSFSADYHEFVGEYVLVGKKMRYCFYAKLMPFAKKARIRAIRLLRR